MTELKRGWWRAKNGELYLWVAERCGKWYGEIDGCSAILMPFNVAEWSRNATYLGDGPEPVEPIQLCLGWWERRDGSTVKIVKQFDHPAYKWLDRSGRPYTDCGHYWSDRRKDNRNIVKRRPDLDAAEVEPVTPVNLDFGVWRLENGNTLCIDRHSPPRGKFCWGSSSGHWYANDGTHEHSGSWIVERVKGQLEKRVEEIERRLGIGGGA